MAPRLDLQLSLRASTSLDRLPTDERSLARPARRKKERDGRACYLCIVCFGKGPWELPSTREPEYSDTVYSERHMEPPETDAERETLSIGGAAR